MTRLERFTLSHPFCCFCGGKKRAETIEHAPPRCFFRKKQRPKGLEFPACKRCNNGSAKLDQVASFFAASGHIFRDENETAMKLFAGIANNYPEVFSYLIRSKPIDVSRSGLLHPMVRAEIHPKLLRDWINPWIAKQAYALWYHHTSAILGEHSRVITKWLTNDAVLKDGVPKALLNMTPNQSTLQQGKFEVSDQFFYRYNINAEHGMGLFVMGAYEASAFVATVIKDTHLLPVRDKLAVGEIYRTSFAKGIYRAPLGNPKPKD